MNNKPLIKQLLREGLFTRSEKDMRMVADFVNFAKEQLGIKDDVKIELTFERTPDLKTTAYYRLDGFIKVYVKERSTRDALFSMAHELVHHQQNIQGRLIDIEKNGADGSEIENEAHAKAGELIRLYGKMHPEIYI